VKAVPDWRPLDLGYIQIYDRRYIQEFDEEKTYRAKYVITVDLLLRMSSASIELSRKP
jgi:hypothetical protein